MSRFSLIKITDKNQIGYFAPRQHQFWCILLVCFCLFTVIGHWLEMPYCLFMDTFFGIVADNYAVWTDPWYHPYWVYGIGAVVMTLVIEPLKEHVILRSHTLPRAVLKTFVLTVLLAMIMELVIGLIVNQPNELGEYPYWDNSHMPLNIFGQAWLVNDIIIGIMATLYVWVLYPLICHAFMKIRPVLARIMFWCVVLGFAACCTVSYIQLGFWKIPL